MITLLATENNGNPLTKGDVASIYIVTQCSCHLISLSSQESQQKKQLWNGLE